MDRTVTPVVGLPRVSGKINEAAHGASHVAGPNTERGRRVRPAKGTIDVMDAPTSISIPSKFNGPPKSGNGGYSAGALAAVIGGPAVVSLRSPPPLETPLPVRRNDGRFEAWYGETLVMYAQPQAPQGVAPPPPDWEIAKQGCHTFPKDEHPMPTCFVCGPKRECGDGLRLFAGPLDDYPGSADVWVPDDSLDDGHGAVPAEVMWAALDCPSYFAIPESPGLALLGSICAKVNRLARVGEPLVVFGWHQYSEGRKHMTGSGLATKDGELLAQADCLWIQLKPNG